MQFSMKERKRNKLQCKSYVLQRRDYTHLGAESQTGRDFYQFNVKLRPIEPYECATSVLLIIKPDEDYSLGNV